MPASDLAIDLKNVEKIYGKRLYALRGIDISVRRGEIFGLLGPNGAGKSTLVKIMMTVVHPTRAAGTVLDRPVGDKAALAGIGYLPENHRFPRHLTGRQVLDLFGGLGGMSRAQRRSKGAELLEQVGMTDAADRRVATYSKGMLQRIGLAQAMMNNPALIVLDEPTDGVDPIGRMQIRGVLQALRAAGTTVFINSHLLSELEHLCDRVAILLAGSVAKQGSIDELSSARQRYEIEVHETPGGSNAIRSALHARWTDSSTTRGELPDGTWIEITESIVRIGSTDPHAAQPILDRLRSAGLVIRRFQMVRPTLEELFVEAVGERASAAPPPPLHS
ncbi:MAG: ABC transporter ATP-binding protein [Phycisphaerae bacterium]|nr:ABC transporter ATP-binding protein [Phycisphaerae bacterium]